MTASTFPDAYLLPGEAVFPEGITEGPDGTFFVGSLTDGSVRRGHVTRPETQVWLAGGVDGRTAVAGLHVDPRGRLVTAGMATGLIGVYDLAGGGCVGTRRVPAQETLLNDVVTTADAAYVTDSARPVVWRLPLDVDGLGGVGEPRMLIDLAPVGATEGSFLNGIVASPDGALLLVVDQATGELWRVDVGREAATRVDLGGYGLSADGLLLRHDDHGDVLLGVTNEGETLESLTFQVSALRLSTDWRSARLAAQVTDDRWDAPTTLAEVAGRLLVVSSQVLHRDDPRPPFLVLALDLPDVPAVDVDAPAAPGSAAGDQPAAGTSSC